MNTKKYLVHEVASKIEVDLTLLTKQAVYKALTQEQYNRIILDYIANDIPKEYYADYAQRVSNSIKEVYEAQSYAITLPNAISILDYETVSDLDRLILQLPKEMQVNYNLMLDQTQRLVQQGMSNIEATQVMANSPQFRGVTVRDSLGRRVRIDTMINRNIREAMRNSSNLATEEIARQLNTDVFQITTHANPREKCIPWQLQLVSNREFTYTNGKVSKHVYALSDTSYGQADGLFGINCRHIKMPYVLGVSIPSKFDPIGRVDKSILDNTSKTNIQLDKVIIFD